MEQKKVKARLAIAREEDREKVAGILVKNGIAVAQIKDYGITKNGEKAKTMKFFLVVEAEAEND